MPSMTHQETGTSPRSRRAASPAGDGDNASLRPLLLFAAIALPVGWVTLSVPVALGLAQEPFVLLALVLGLILPALLLTARESGRPGMRALLRDAVRLPRPLWWAPVAALALPATVWAAASTVGGAQPLTSELLVDFAVALVTVAVIVNVWEEMAWTGFVQRRSMARWGVLGGTLVTGVLFAGIHLPLAFDGATAAGDVLLGVAVLLATGIGLRLLIAGVDAWSGRSLLTAGVLHAAFNASADLINPDHDWVRYVVTVVLGLVFLAALLSARGRHAAPGQPSQSR